MLVDTYLRQIKTCFRYRRQIEAAVQEKRAEFGPPRLEVPDRHKISDPTGSAAVRNLTRLENVTIFHKGKSITIKNPEEWLEVIDEIYSAYDNEPLGRAVREHLEKGRSAETVSDDMGYTKAAYYNNLKRLLIDAAFLAQKKGLL